MAFTPINKLDVIKEELSEYVNSEKSNFLQNFFQAYPGSYNEVNRTMLRYTIEKFILELRNNFLFGKITTETKKQEG